MNEEQNEQPKPAKRLSRRTIHILQKRKWMRLGLICAFLLCLVSLVLIVSVCCRLAQANAALKKETEQEQKEPPKEEPKEVYRTFEISSSEPGAGNLVLVNGKNEYLFPESEQEKLTSVYAYFVDKTHNCHYKLSRDGLLLCEEALTAFNALTDAYYATFHNNNILITTAYRTYAEQVGKTMKAGFSDHHTGYTLALSMMYDNGTMTTVDGDAEVYLWLCENAWKYGFIQRYPADKIAVTGVTNYLECFRYVGVLHAYTMKTRNLCMEEYISLLHEHPFTSEHLALTDAQGNVYEAYYIPAASGTTTISVPENASYTLSGDNSGGFIVVVSKS